MIGSISLMVHFFKIKSIKFENILINLNSWYIFWWKKCTWIKLKQDLKDRHQIYEMYQTFYKFKILYIYNVWCAYPSHVIDLVKYYRKLALNLSWKLVWNISSESDWRLSLVHVNIHTCISLFIAMKYTNVRYEI